MHEPWSLSERVWTVMQPLPVANCMTWDKLINVALLSQHCKMTDRFEGDNTGQST